MTGIIKRLLGPHSDALFALLRVVAAFMFLLHGLQKFGMLGGLGGFVPPTFSLLWWAKWIETIGGPLLIVGLGTRWVAFILCGEMAVAYFYRHFPMSFWPLLNGGEITVLYCFLWLYLAARGPGRFSVDSVIGIEK
jgi:putative oxidoreductase